MSSMNLLHRSHSCVSVAEGINPSLVLLTRMFHTNPFGNGALLTVFMPTDFAPPLANDPSILDVTPAILKLYPMIGIPTSPRVLICFFIVLICSFLLGPSRSTSNQSDGSKFSTASSSNP